MARLPRPGDRFAVRLEDVVPLEADERLRDDVGETSPPDLPPEESDEDDE